MNFSGRTTGHFHLLHILRGFHGTNTLEQQMFQFLENLGSVAAKASAIGWRLFPVSADEIN
ncbi:conserved hypothetical protein [Ahrensia sp. R2A130]|nr:conserved hypothetical protein [Ahrensia sp. R2A130]